MSSDSQAGEAMGQYGRITSLADLPKEKELVKQIKEAIKVHDAGVKPRAVARTTEKKELEMPDYFLAALKKNKKALATFEQFNYSNKKEYLELDHRGQNRRHQEEAARHFNRMDVGRKSRNWKYQTK